MSVLDNLTFEFKGDGEKVEIKKEEVKTSKGHTMLFRKNKRRKGKKKSSQSDAGSKVQSTRKPKSTRQKHIRPRGGSIGGRVTRMFTIGKKDKEQTSSDNGVSDGLDRRDSALTVDESYPMQQFGNEFSHENEGFKLKEENIENLGSLRSGSTNTTEQSKKVEKETNTEILINFYNLVKPERKNNEQRARQLVSNYDVGKIAHALNEKYGHFPKAWIKEYQEIAKQLE